MYEEVISAPIPVFISDEKVLHLMVVRYQTTGRLIVESGRWNCSPKFQPAGLADSDVGIYHFHGDSCVRPGKSPRGFLKWYPVFQLHFIVVDRNVMSGFMIFINSDVAAEFANDFKVHFPVIVLVYQGVVNFLGIGYRNQNKREYKRNTLFHVQWVSI